jgi:hypothetical protein
MTTRVVPGFDLRADDRVHINHPAWHGTWRVVRTVVDLERESDGKLMSFTLLDGQEWQLVPRLHPVPATDPDPEREVAG